MRETLQALYRLTVMVGTLAVLALAVLAYGPPPERLARMADRVAEVLRQELLGPDDQQLVPLDQPTETAATASPLPAPLAPVGQAEGESLVPFAGHYDSAVAPASFAAPIAGQYTDTGVSADTEAQFHALGLRQVALEKWGDRGEQVRLRCQMPASAGGWIQHLEAVADSPAAAAQQVLAEARQLQQVSALR